MPIKDNTITRERAQRLADRLVALPERVFDRVEGVVEGIEIANDLLNSDSAAAS